VRKKEMGKEKTSGVQMHGESLEECLFFGS
jgi:hypothetical protein